MTERMDPGLMRTGEDGLSLIKASESLQRDAYQCSAGVWTIGYGHTKGVREGDTCTEAQAEAWLKADLAEAEDIVARLITVPLTQRQFDALVSFAFNYGESKMGRYRLTAWINSADPANWKKISGKWLEYIHDVIGGRVYKRRGLYIRRMRELLLWHGFPWQIARMSADENLVDIATTWQPMKAETGFVAKEFFADGTTPWSEVFKRARHFATGINEHFEEMVTPPPLPVEPDPDYAPHPVEPEPDYVPPVRPVPQMPAPIYEEPLPPVPSPKPKPSAPIPYGEYDPTAEPKHIAFSKRVQGLVMIVVGWFTMLLEAFSQVPFVKELAAMSPLKAENTAMAMLILCAGFVWAFYGQVKAKGPLK